MVWAFPEAGMVVLGVKVTLCVTAPEPLPVLIVYEVLFDILPASESLSESIKFT